MLREGQVLFTYLHLAANEPQTRALAEPVQLETSSRADKDHLPLLTPMSEFAGRKVQVGALDWTECRRIASGVPGVLAGCVLGGGVAGGAARIAMGFEAKVTVLDRSLSRLDELDWRYGAQINTVYSTVGAVERHVRDADLVIGLVLVPGAAALEVITEEMIKSMRPSSVLVDIAIDQGGRF